MVPDVRGQLPACMNIARAEATMPYVAMVPSRAPSALGSSRGLPRASTPGTRRSPLWSVEGVARSAECRAARLL